MNWIRERFNRSVVPEVPHEPHMQTQFVARIEPLQTALQRYCLSITRSEVEAEDLQQETLLKAYVMFIRKHGHQQLSKAYLFRIASNAWIDRCRKERLHVDSFSDTAAIPALLDVDALELQHAMETLIAALPVRQRIVLLLVECLRFTSGETARLMQTTEGAVKAMLNRAKSKLRTHSGKDSPAQPGSRERVDEKVVYAYLAAFRAQDAQALLLLLNDSAQLDLVPVVTGKREATGRTSPRRAEPQPKTVLSVLPVAYAA